MATPRLGEAGPQARLGEWVGKVVAPPYGGGELRTHPYPAQAGNKNKKPPITAAFCFS